jgi:hypothetical protein
MPEKPSADAPAVAARKPRLLIVEVMSPSLCRPLPPAVHFLQDFVFLCFGPPLAAETAISFLLRARPA